MHVFVWWNVGKDSVKRTFWKDSFYRRIRHWMRHTYVVAPVAGLWANTLGPERGLCQGPPYPSAGRLVSLVALPELHPRQLWGGRMPHPRRLWALSPGRRRICGWHCSLGLGWEHRRDFKNKGP